MYKMDSDVESVFSLGEESDFAPVVSLLPHSPFDGNSCPLVGSRHFLQSHPSFSPQREEGAPVAPSFRRWMGA